MEIHVNICTSQSSKSIFKKKKDRTMWRARFGSGFGLVVKQTTK